MVTKKIHIQTGPNSSDFFFIPNFLTVVNSDGFHATHFHYRGRAIRVPGTLAKFAELLKPFNFCRISKSHIVSLDKILSYNKKEVVLDNQAQTSLRVGKKYYPELNKMFEEMYNNNQPEKREN